MWYTYTNRKLLEKEVWILAEEVLKKIQETEKKADELIAEAGENAKNILKNIEQKIKTDGDKILSEIKNELKTLKEKTVEDTEKFVSTILIKENEQVESILNIDESRIDEIAGILKERIVR